MLAAKHLDIVTGIDIHIILIPTPGGPVPTPLPHPFVGILFDPDDYDPKLIAKAYLTVAMAKLKAEGVLDLTPVLNLGGAVMSAVGGAKSFLPSEQVKNLVDKARGAMKEALGIHPPNTDAATIFVNNLPRIHCGSKGKALPPHIPMGGPFQKGKVGNVCEAFMGSMTVSADKSPMTFMGCMINSCHCIGMPSMHNKGSDQFMPTSVVMCIPMGNPIMVGGPPVPDLNAMMNKLFDKLFNKALAMIKNSKFVKKLSKKLHNTAKKLMDKMGIPADSFVRDMVHNEICETTGHPVTIATGKVFTTAKDFGLPGSIPLSWSREWKSTSQYSGVYGNGWHCNYDLALGWDRADDVVVVRMKDGRPVIFPPMEEGESFTNPHENLTLIKHKDHYLLRDKNRYYRFNKGNSFIKKEQEIYPLAAVEDARGFSIQFEYSKQGHLQQIIDSVGRVLKVTCDREGRIIKIDAPHPKHRGETFTLLSYQYDREGNLIECKDALGKPFKYSYHNKLLVRETNRNGLSFYFEYDENERCVHTWGDGGIYDHKLTYDLEEQWTEVEDSLGNKSKYHWNDKGLNWKIVDAKGNIRYKRYTNTSKVQSVVNELGYTTSYEYDDEGNKIKTIYPDGSSIEKNYVDGLLTSAADPNGGKWAWEYNEHHQLTKRTNCMGESTTYEYQNGLLYKYTNSIGGDIFVEYNEFNTYSKIIDPDGGFVSAKYDYLGRVIENTNIKGNTTKRKYDLLGRVIKMWTADGNVFNYDYDAEGNLLTDKDKSFEVKTEYTHLNRVKTLKRGSTKIEYNYDTEGNIISLTNEQGNVCTYELDEKYNVISETGFDGIQRKYERNEHGQIIKTILQNGQIREFEYDLLGRKIGIIHTDGSFEKFTYTPRGYLMSAANNHIKIEYERDGLGRILKEIQGGFVVESIYDASGFRTQLKSSLGADLNFERNIMGDLLGVNAKTHEKDWDISFSRGKAGTEIESIFPGHLKSIWKKDHFGQPTEHKISIQGKVDKLRNYTWENRNRLKKLEDKTKGENIYEHNVYGDLASVTYFDGTKEYKVPDEIGNIFKNTDRSDRKYGATGKLLESYGVKYEYDEVGNLVKKIHPNGEIWRYFWNAFDRLQKVVRPDGHPVTFTYDAIGRRIAKKYRDNVTRWVWDNNNILHEWAEKTVENPVSILPEMENRTPNSKIRIRPKINLSRGANESENPTLQAPVEEVINISIFNPSDDVTTWIFNPKNFTPLGKLKGKEQFSIISDHIGTPIAMYNNKGESIWEMNLTIYGEIKNLKGWRDLCPYRYPGQYEDQETGLYYNRFRYYSPKEGIYISQDPLRLGGNSSNFYVYTKDVNYWIDPFGLKESVYQLKKGDEVVYYGITERDPVVRAKEHDDTPEKDFDTMEVIAEFDTGDSTTDHDMARTLEARKIRARMEERSDYEDYDSVQDKLAKSGLQNKNRGRDIDQEGREYEGEIPELDEPKEVYDCNADK